MCIHNFLGESVCEHCGLTDHEFQKGLLHESESELYAFRKALSALSGAAYDVVKANSDLTMAGPKYRTPKIAKLAEAMYAANKLFREAAESESAEPKP